MKTLLGIVLIILTVPLARCANIITITGTNSYAIGADEVVEVISSASSHIWPSLRVNGAVVNLYVDGNSYKDIISVVPPLPVIVAGPGSISPTYFGYLTLIIRTKAEYLEKLNAPSYANSTGVVIPEDAAGPVEIVLESSTDLVNWTGANPGTYGSSTAKRFFRVRAIQKSQP